MIRHVAAGETWDGRLPRSPPGRLGAHRPRPHRARLRRRGRAGGDGRLLQRRHRGAPPRGRSPAKRGGVGVPRARERDPRLVAGPAPPPSSSSPSSPCRSSATAAWSTCAATTGRSSVSRWRPPTSSTRDGFMRLQEPPDRARRASTRSRARCGPGEPQLPEQIEAEDRTPWATDEAHLRGSARASPAASAMVAPIKSGRAPARHARRSRCWASAGVRASARSALVRELARRASTAIENARLYEERTYIAETLQQSLLPTSLPSVEGFELAAHLPPGRREAPRSAATSTTCSRPAAAGWAVAIADVCGKGVGGGRRHVAGAPHAARRGAAPRTGPAEMLRDRQRRDAAQLPREPVLHRRAGHRRERRAGRASDAHARRAPEPPDPARRRRASSRWGRRARSWAWSRHRS